GLHISDALAEWVLANGVRSIMVGTPEKLSEPDIVAAIREPRTLANVNDSGAHLQLFSGAGEHMYLLTHYVREAGLLSVEAAVHDDGILVLDACPSRAVFEQFSQSPQFRDAVATAGLPSPRVDLVGEVHAARGRGIGR